MTGADPGSGGALGPHLLIGIAAIAWFALVVPIAAWLETRAQRGDIQEIKPGSPAPPDPVGEDAS